MISFRNYPRFSEEVRGPLESIKGPRPSRGQTKFTHKELGRCMILVGTSKNFIITDPGCDFFRLN